MLNSNEKKPNNNYVLETDSKTKSSSITDEKETIVTKMTIQRKEIKRNRTLALKKNYHIIKPIHYSSKKIDFNKINNIDYLNNFMDKEEDKNNKTMKNHNIDYIQKYYNLTEAYYKNNILEEIQKNKKNQENKGIHHNKIYEIINVSNKNINNNNINDKLININNSNNINNFNIYKYNEEPTEEEYYNNYTASYRDKMFNEMKKKLNKDYIDDESLSELKSDNEENNFIINKTQRESHSAIKNNNIKNKEKKVKFIFNTQKSQEEKPTQFNLTEIKNNSKKKLINSNKKDKIKYLLIKDLLKNKEKKNVELSLTKKSLNTNIYNRAINNCFAKEFHKKSYNKIKSKKNFQNRENIFKLDKSNNINNNDFFNKKIINSIINNKLANHSLNKNKAVYSQEVSGFLEKGSNNNDEVPLNLKNNIMLKINKNIKSKSSKKEDKDKNFKKIEIDDYNIKNHIINTNDNNFFNKTMINNYKWPKKSILKNNKKKSNKIINKASSLENRDIDKIKKRNNNLLKNNDKNNYYCKILINKTNIKIEFVSQIVSQPLFKEDTIESKDNNNLNLKEKLNKNEYINKYKSGDINVIKCNNSNNKKESNKESKKRKII